ncbi:MAG: diphthamide synthesis protein [Candidatus Nanoarchaeia archaeon]|nr:diphthamide synthesis protein [Candidatus Nanoarchaeia archaeon]
MKKIFIEAKSKEDISEVLTKVKLNCRIGLASSIQFLDQLKIANKQLKNSIIAGQVLGCNADSCRKIKNRVDCFLYIGSGEFHPTRVAIETSKPVYIANPLTNTFSKLDSKIVENYKKSVQGKLSKFYRAEKVGIIFSTKSGQNKLAHIESIKKKIKKETYLFVADFIDTRELENFPDIDIWVNTACPRIEDKSIINLEDLRI